MAFNYQNMLGAAGTGMQDFNQSQQKYMADPNTWGSAGPRPPGYQSSGPVSTFMSGSPSYTSGASGYPTLPNSSGQPPIPDFGALAGQQKGANDYATNQTNLANRPDQYNPFGSTTWQQGPNGQWTQNNAFNAQGQALFDQSMAAQNKIMGGMGEPPEASFGAQQNVIDAWNRLQQPGLDARASAARARAANMGLTMGSEGSDTTERNIGSTYREGEDTAIGKGVDAWNQLFDRQLNAYNAKRGALSDISGVMQNMNPNKWNTNVPTSGSYSPETIYGSALDTFNARRQNENARIAERQANIQGITSGIQALGGYKGLSQAGSDAVSAGKAGWDAWNKYMNGTPATMSADSNPIYGLPDYTSEFGSEATHDIADAAGDTFDWGNWGSDWGW